MQSVINARNLSLAGLAASLVAAVIAATATFSAPAPGASLQPVGNADQIVQVLQGQSNLLWTSLTGPVEMVVVEGWPATDGEIELGGALYMEQPADSAAGVIDFGEPPMTAIFTIGG